MKVDPFLTAEEAAVVRALHRIAKRWPSRLRLIFNHGPGFSLGVEVDGETFGLRDGFDDLLGDSMNHIPELPATEREKGLSQ